MNKLSIQTNNARNVLQNSSNFSTPEKAIIEYVKNGYNYKKNKVPSEVHVQCNENLFSIADNGSGMGIYELTNNFLVMNGENSERAKGNITDGEFGTGKSAALGVGNILSVKTVRDGLLNHIEIHKEDVRDTSSTDDVPVRHLIENEKTDALDGTLIEIKELNPQAKKYKLTLIRNKIIS